MLDFHQRRKIKTVLYDRTTLIVLSVLVIISLHSTWKVYGKKRESEALKNISVQNVDELTSRDNELKSKIRRLETDSGIEEEIRSKFSVAKQGEQMVVVVEDEISPISTSSPKGIFKVFFNFLFK